MELFLLLTYFATSASLLPLWELSGDDVIHFEFARSMVQTGHLPLLGPLNSFGFSESAWVNWIQAGFYALHPSFVAIQWGTIGLQTLAHWFLFRIGENLGDRRIGYAASLLFFTAPAFAGYLNLRFWELSLLPCFAAASLHFLLRYVGRSHPRDLIFALVAAGLAVSAHSSFLFFYPVLLFPVVQQGWRSNPWRSPGPALALGASLAFGLFPYLMLLDLAWAAPGAGVGLHGATVPNGSELWQKTSYLLCFGSSFIPHRLRMTTDSWTEWTVPWEGGLVGLFIFGESMRFKSLNAARRIFLFWILLPLALLLISTAVLKPFLYHHWLVILFPALFVAVSLPLFARRVPRHFSHAWIGLLVLGGLWRSGQILSFIHETGGTGWHLASLSTREEVLRKLSAIDRSAALYVEVSPGGGMAESSSMGWKSVRSQMLSQGLLPMPDGAPTQSFHILERRSTGFPSKPTPESLGLPGASEFQIGPVTIYASPGIRVDSRFRL